MSKFEIRSKNSQGELLKPTPIEANNEFDARQSFMNMYGKHNNLSIVNVRNLTVENNAYKIAAAIGQIFEKSKNPTVSEVAKFGKPIAAIAVELQTQYKHILEGDEIDDISTVAKGIYNHILSSFTRN